MNDKIKLTCPHCKHKWEKPLDELEKIETIFRLYEDHRKQEAQKKVVSYRAICPNDGTYIIVEVEED